MLLVSHTLVHTPSSPSLSGAISRNHRPFASSMMGVGLSSSISNVRMFLALSHRRTVFTVSMKRLMANVALAVFCPLS